MTVGLDIDDVCRDFVGQLVKCYRQDYPEHAILPITSWDMSKSFPIGKEIKTYFKETRAKEIYLDAPMVGGARPMIDLLGMLGHRVVLVTNQPNYAAKKLTIEWMEKNHLDLEIMFLRDKSLARIDILLDDATHNLRAVTQAGIKAIAYDRPWNQDWKGARVNSNYEFAELFSIKYANSAGC